MSKNIFCRYGQFYFTNVSTLTLKYGTRRAKPAGTREFRYREASHGGVNMGRHVNTSMQINRVGPYIDNCFDMLSACFRQVVFVLYT